jgi:hypothetical protein
VDEVKFNQKISIYNQINSKLIDYDFIVSPYYHGGKIKVLKKVTDKLPSTSDISTKERIGEMIAKELYKDNLSFNFRAILIVEGYMKGSFLKKLSHLIEIGMIEFYRWNFIACSAIWYPLVEGIIRELLAIPIGTTFRKATHFSQLRALRAIDIRFQPFLDILISNLIDYFENVLFKNVRSSSDLPSHNFNRHFFGHSLSSESYYYGINCLKFINIFDIFLAINQILDNHFQALFNGKSDEVKQREKYYYEIYKDSMSDLNLFKIELFKQHINFDENEFFAKFT